MKALATAIRREAHGIGTEADAALEVNRGVVFSGPGRSGFDQNTGAVVGVLRGARQHLEEAADRVTTEAARIERAQSQWTRDHRRIQAQITDLKALIGNVLQ